MVAVDVRIRVPVPGSKSREVVVSQEQHPRFAEEKAAVASGVAGSGDHFHRNTAEVDNLSSRRSRSTGRGAVIEIIGHDSSPICALVFIFHAVEIQQTIEILERGRVRLRTSTVPCF